MNHRRWTIVCLLLSVPLVIHLANRRSARAQEVVRFATLDLGLTADGAAAALRGGASAQGRRLAAIVQHAQPDVLLLCGLTRADAAAVADAFAREYLAVPQHGQRAIEFRWRHASPPPVPPGSPPPPATVAAVAAAPRGGLALLSRHPILTDRVRVFDALAWSAMPGALRPEQVPDPTWAALPLSTAGHWDVPIGIGDPAAGGRVVHVLCSQPTPAVADGDGGDGDSGDARAAVEMARRRNHDEIRFWSDYVTPGAADWIAGGGLAANDGFVILGTLGVDPVDGAGRHDAIRALLANPRVQDPRPRSAGADEAAKRQFGANARHGGEASLDTADLDDTPGKGPGNLRLDYVLPSRDLAVADARVLWPLAREALASLAAASPHRLVWVDVAVR